MSTENKIAQHGSSLLRVEPRLPGCESAACELSEPSLEASRCHVSDFFQVIPKRLLSFHTIVKAMHQKQTEAHS